MFECSRCGYTTGVKCNLRNHLRRKKVCEATFIDIDRNDLISMLYPKGSSLKNEKLINNKKSVKCNPNVSKMSVKRQHSITDDLKKTEKHYSCSYCGKTFKHRQTRYRHTKNHCGEKKKQEATSVNESNSVIDYKHKLIELQEKLEEQQLIIERLSQQNTTTNNTTNNNTNNNTNNINKHNTNSFNTVNVTLNTIGNENIKYLKSFLLKNIHNIIQCKTDFFIDYVKQKHFHPEHIENHNVVSFNQRSNSMYGYTKQDTHLERRLKNSMSLVLYKNIIDDVSVFVETQLGKKKNKPKKEALLNRAADRMVKQEDAVYDYEHKDVESDSDEGEKKNNIKVVDTHLKEIENTIYNESKSAYGDISAYYVKHNESNDDTTSL